MKKTVTAALALVCMLAGCGSDTSAAATASANDAANALKEELGGNFSEEDAAVITKLLGVEDGDIKDAKAYLDNDNNARMIIVVEAADEDKALYVSDRMDYYVTTLEKSAGMYNPEQLELIDGAYIYTKGNYSILAIADDPAAVKKAVAALKLE